MRDPIASAEAQRVKEAVEEACRRLGRLRLDITSWTDQGADTLDPAKERRHAIALVKTVADNIADADLKSLLLKAIPAIERMRPAASSHGRGTDEWAERDHLIVETIRAVCETFGFRPTRSPFSYSKRHCGCSIVSTALGQLGIWLSEATVKEIWRRRSRA